MKDSTRKRIMEISLDTLEGYQYEYSKKALENLDLDATITFAGKHFVLSGYGGGDISGEEVQLITEKGGIIHSSMVKAADYLLVKIKSCGKGKLEKALEWRKKGTNVKIICHEMFEEAVGIGPVPSASARDNAGQDADLDEASFGLQEGWTRIPKKPVSAKRLQGKNFHDLNQCEFFQHPVYFRGPVFQIRELMARYAALHYKNLGNGIGQVMVDNNHKEGQKLQKIIREFPCLRCAGFTSWSGAQCVFMSDSGYDVITHVKILDYTKYEGEHWIDEADVLKNGVYTVSDSRTGERWKERYTFPFRDAWLSDKYYIQVDGQPYLCCPETSKTASKSTAKAK